MACSLWVVNGITGAEKIGCLVIPAGPGDVRAPVNAHAGLPAPPPSTSCPATPWTSPASSSKRGPQPPQRPRLRKAFVGAEPHTEETRRRIEQLFEFGLWTSTPDGLTEMNGPGVAFECEHKAGLHLWEDNYILEIINLVHWRTPSGGPDRRSSSLPPPSTARPCPSSVTAPGTSPPSYPKPEAAAAPIAAWPAITAAPTTCSSSAA